MVITVTKLPYDKTNPADILRYSEELEGITFQNVLQKIFSGEELEEKVKYYDNPRSKGGLGNLLEEHYYFYSPNSISDADFVEAGVELKVTPYEINKNNQCKAGERLVITMIPNNEPISDDFETSHLKQKISHILMVWYERIRGEARTKQRIQYVNLYNLYSEICKNDLEIIRNDYKRITEKIIAGKAHELSEGDTQYLGACTKGATAERSLQPQYYNDTIPAKRRAFSLKQSYMTYVLNQYVKKRKMSFDAIFTPADLQKADLETQVIERIEKYVGNTEEALYSMFGFTYTQGNRPKHINTLLVNRMLGVQTDQAEEFAKADIKIKTIRVQKNGKPKESMSFPKIKIKEFVKQDFEESAEYNFFQETKFLFVVFKETNTGEYILKGAKFWNMPIMELEGIGRAEWESYKKKFLTGVNFTITKDKSGKEIIKNDLPSKSEHTIFHLRPHAQKSAYVINGKRYGMGNDRDMDDLPNGDKMTCQCFWLNNDYIAKIIEDI